MDSANYRPAPEPIRESVDAVAGLAALFSCADPAKWATERPSPQQIGAILDGVSMKLRDSLTLIWDIAKD